MATRPVDRVSPLAIDFAPVVADVRGSVVSIVVTPRSGLPDGAPEAREFFERHYGVDALPGDAVGSGFVVRSDGHIVTNAHVVEDAAAVFVTLPDDGGRRYPARVVGLDEPSDVALLRIPTERPLRPLPLGDSDALRVGDWVAAVGNPFGLSHSLTVGVVSSLGRSDIHPGGRPGYHDFIQVDAAINPGNSGGPLLDRQGRVVGINSAVNARGQGIGFAIPVRMMQAVLPALFEAGTVRRGWMGVSVQELEGALAASFGVASGLVVTEVAESGPAARAGLLPGDVLLALDGTPLKRAPAFRWSVSTLGEGRYVSLLRRRRGEEGSVAMALAPLPGAETKPLAKPPAAPVDAVHGPHGLEVVAEVASDGAPAGLRVVEVDPYGAAAVAGVERDDLLLEAGDQPLVSAFSLGAATRGPLVRLRLQRGQRSLYVAWRRPDSAQ